MKFFEKPMSVIAVFFMCNAAVPLRFCLIFFGLNFNRDNATPSANVGMKLTTKITGRSRSKTMH